MRHPSFKGMREDKNAKDVHAEIAQKMVKTKEHSVMKIKAEKKGERKTLVNPKEDTQVKIVNESRIKI